MLCFLKSGNQLFLTTKMPWLLSPSQAWGLELHCFLPSLPSAPSLLKTPIIPICLLCLSQLRHWILTPLLELFHLAWKTSRVCPPLAELHRDEQSKLHTNAVGMGASTLLMACRPRSYLSSWVDALPPQPSTLELSFRAIKCRSTLRKPSSPTKLGGRRNLSSCRRRTRPGIASAYKECSRQNCRAEHACGEDLHAEARGGLEVGRMMSSLSSLPPALDSWRMF